MSITSTPSAKDKINPRLDHLLSKIENPALRSELDREINKLKMNKKFGLVFEEHMPEHVRLPEISIAIGSKVVKKAGRGDDVFVVQSMKDKTTMITHEIDGHFEEVDPADLIVIKKFEEPIYPSLIPIDRVVRAKEKPFHTIINAENFNALELLLYSNEKQVDVIYIDPPYNTGARDWKYNNNYIDSNDAYRHSKWLSMMKRRLLISKRLLHKNGVLIVTIDENELPTLNLLLWELFPDFDATPVTIRHNPRGIQGDNFSYCNEVAFFLTRKKLKIVLPRKLSKDEVEPSPLRKWGNDSLRNTAKNCFYPIYFDGDAYFKSGEVPSDDFHPKSAFHKMPSGLMEFWPIDNDGVERKWRYARQSVEEISHLLTIEKRNGVSQVIITKGNAQYKTLWTDSIFDSSTHGKRLLSKIIKDDFSFPKSLYAVAECLKATTEKQSLILDFFAGSGTTLHATCLLNAEDGGNRRCILVTNNEVGEKKEKELAKQGIFAGHKDYEKHGICESVTWPRCKYAVNGKRDDGTELVGEYLSGRKMNEGFEENIQYFKLGYLDPNDVEYRHKLADILPILWLSSGAKGTYEALKKIGEWFMPEHSTYAILIEESSFAEWRKALSERPEISHVFIVTDSEEAYRDMCRKLPRKIEAKMLYRSFLENFRINIPHEV